jgi:hypothetical protein
MKANKIIICSIIIIVVTSCMSEKYRFVTQVDRDGSCRREIYATVSTTDSISGLFPYDLSFGWEITQTDTIVEEYLSSRNKNNIKISKKFGSVDELSANLRCDMIFPIPKESIKKRFRWFYTYHTFTAVYPELTEKGRVPMDNYLNKTEQKFYLQGDISAYKGMSGIELKEKLDDIETRFWEWYFRNVYEENFDIILQISDTEFRSMLPAVKDSLYSMNKKQVDENKSSMSEVCTMLDKYFATVYFSNLYAGNRQEMDDVFNERTKLSEELLRYNIQYDLILPGKIMASNTDLQNKDGILTWNINLFRFLSDDYTLVAESRTVNGGAFAVTLLLIGFAGYCFGRK